MSMIGFVMHMLTTVAISAVLTLVLAFSAAYFLRRKGVKEPDSVACKRAEEPCAGMITEEPSTESVGLFWRMSGWWW